MDLAVSKKKIIEDIVLNLSTDITKEAGEHNLCLADGVALNCVVNRILLCENFSDNIWIQPAAVTLVERSVPHFQLGLYLENNAFKKT